MSTIPTIYIIMTTDSILSKEADITIIGRKNLNEAINNSEKGLKQTKERAYTRDLKINLTKFNTPKLK